VADLRPSVTVAIAEAKRAFPRYWRITHPERGAVEVYDGAVGRHVATVFGATDEEQADG
jgi:hypothetical protein